MNTPTYLSGLLFTKAHRLVRVRILQVLENHSLNTTYWAILSATAHSPEGIRLSNVASQLGVKAPMVTTDATALIKMGLIRRIPHHSDKRAKLLITTPKGKKLVAIVEVELNQEISQLLSGLTSKEIAAFQKTLETIIKNSNT